MSNYDKILRDKENNTQIDFQDKEKNWLALATQLHTSAAKPRGSSSISKMRKLYTIVAGAAAVIVVVLSMHRKPEIDNRVSPGLLSTVKTSAIKRPLNNIDIPFESFSFDADRGDTLFTKNGSILIFPANAVLDKSGHAVVGKVDVRFRDFNDPLDYFIAGIPMNYDSAGIQYSFISSAMIDIGAYQNGVQLQVNPLARPTMNLVSTNKDKNTNLYYLDTTTGRWLSKGKDIVIQGYEPQKTKARALRNVAKNVVLGNESEVPTALEKPLLPQKANGQNPTIRISIDPASFRELMAYDNLKFEVMNSSTATVAEDAKTEWDNVDLKKAGDKYFARFSLGKKYAEYEVKPVLEGKDYDAAMSVYNKKLSDYNALLKERMAAEKKTEDSLLAIRKSVEGQNMIIAEENNKTALTNQQTAEQNERIEAQNQRIAALNALIIERNNRAFQEVQRRNAAMQNESISVDSLFSTDSGSKKRLRDKLAGKYRTADSLTKIREMENRGFILDQNLLRSFTIDNFGYWNCDRPTIPPTVPVVPLFVNERNDLIPLVNVTIAVNGINRLISCSASKVFITPRAKQMIWGVWNNQLYFTTTKTYDDFTSADDSGTVTIVLTRYDGKVTEIDLLKRLLYRS